MTEEARYFLRTGIARRSPQSPMRVRYCFTLLAMLAALAPCSGQVAARELSFEYRVKAQEAIERVYYSHQVGVTRPFEEAVPRSLLEQKVRTYLKQSVALERFWNTPVTTEMLRAELERMVRETRMPDRLRGLFAALSNDSFLIQECLARPVLADRMARSFFAGDQLIHGGARKEAAKLRDRLLRGQIDPYSWHPGRSVQYLARIDPVTASSRPIREWSPPQDEGRDEPTLKLLPEEFDLWVERTPPRAGEAGPVSEERDRFVITVPLEREPTRIRLATFVVEKRTWEDWWSEIDGLLDGASVEAVASTGGPLTPVLTDTREEGSSAWTAPLSIEKGSLSRVGIAAPQTASPCSEDDTWDNGSLDDTPDARGYHTAVWTGSHMIVWGGVGGSNTGARYDPATDTWAPTSTTGAPPGGSSVDWAVWTGKVMMVWGSSAGAGGRYDPVNDIWTPISAVNAPEARAGDAAIWTGSRLIVWGGRGGPSQYLDTGGIYDPEADTWASMSTTNAPAAREGHVAVWTGGELVVWGGRYIDLALGAWVDLNTGGRYDPGADRWLPTSTVNAPQGRAFHTAVWTGSRMVVWGGVGCSVYPCANVQSGGRYDPATDTWAGAAATNQPSARFYHTAVWTGSLMIVWGGGLDGGRYDPASDSWTPTSTMNVPTARNFHTAVWTGSLMIVWGGGSSEGYVNTGGRYDPAADAWTPTSTANAPEARAFHTAVWTGNLMVIWGGYAGAIIRSTGGRYDPATDSWTPTSMTNAPSPHERHSAVWTGNVMVIWGGLDSTRFPYLNTGGRYDPVSDTWTPTSTTNPPSGRFYHTAVWTGDRMVVWGGAGGSNTGGRYDSLADAWTPTSLFNAPSPRELHSAVWTGNIMVVWGGSGAGGVFDTGGRYDPATDTWTPTSTTNAPTALNQHRAMWTGDLMIVWGGGGGSDLNTGGRYDPVSDTWTSLSTANAPGATGHTVVWTGSEMIVWGGVVCASYGEEYTCTYSETGGRYDPATDTWRSTSTTHAPAARSGHTAVWTGHQMVIWGGTNGGLEINKGGRYCACAEVAFSRDSDGDGLGNTAVSIEACSPPAGYVSLGGDCDDADASVWGPPAEIESLVFVDSITLQWTAPPFAGATSVVYDLIRSDLPASFATSATCVESDSSAVSSTDTTVPASGSAFHYLVRAQNGCPNGQGPLGSDSDGTPRTGRACP